MDFFASQELARRNTRRLVVYFFLALICMIFAVYVVVMFVTSGFLTEIATGVSTNSFEADDPVSKLYDPMVLAAVALAVSSVVGLGSAYKISSLRGGGENVAAMLGGRRLPPNSRDPGERRILNVVEEMALAAGAPVPPVYILDNEPSINAFAAGYTVDDAVIGVNRGTIDTLTRDELQGVVAHEFSHILNGDMRMSIRMIGVLHGIQLIALIGYFVLRGSATGRRSSNDKGGGAIILIALGLIVVGWVGLFFARVIKASVSRQREYLADASAVQFTRNPGGIAGALKMIGASTSGSTMQAAGAEETSHMFFGSMFSHPNFVFATHPPLGQRIKRIEPSFQGDYNAYASSRMAKRQRKEEAEHRKQEAKNQGRFLGGRPTGKMGFPGMMGNQFPIDPAILIAGIGLPGDDDVEYSEMLVEQIPTEIAEAARDVFSARCVVFAALLNNARDVRQMQLEAIAQGEGQATLEEMGRLHSMVENLDERYRLPVFEILQGTLTGMSPEQYESFRESVDRLVAADQKVDLFEFFLRHHLLVHLDRRFGRVAPPRVKYRAINPLRESICQLIGVLVRVGHSDNAVAQSAFAAAMQALEKSWQDDGILDANFKYSELEKAIETLTEASPKIKKRVLTAMAVAITHDKQVTVEEAEIFRAMSESLDCPVPPVVASDAPNDTNQS